MINAKIHGEGFEEDILIPTRWEDVSFETYENIAERQLSEEPHDIYDIYSILLKLPVDKVKNISLRSFSVVAEMLNFVTDQSCFSASKHIDQIEIDGIIYKCPADIGRDSKLRYEEWKDSLSRFDNGKPLALIPQTLAYYVRPAGETYAASKISERAEMFRKRLNCVEAVQLNNFFLRNSKELKRSLAAYWIRMTMMRAVRTYLTSLLTVSFLPFILWLAVTFLKWTLSLKSRFMKSIRSFFTKKTSGHTNDKSKPSNERL